MGIQQLSNRVAELEAKLERRDRFIETLINCLQDEVAPGTSERIYEAWHDIQFGEAS